MTRTQENLYVYPQAKVQVQVRWGLGEGQEGWSPVKLTLWLKLNLTFKEDLSNNFWFLVIHLKRPNKGHWAHKELNAATSWMQFQLLALGSIFLSCMQWDCLYTFNCVYIC